VKAYTIDEENSELLKDIKIKLTSDSEKMNYILQEFNKSLYELEERRREDMKVKDGNELPPVKEKTKLKLKISNSVRPITAVPTNNVRTGYHTARPGTSISETKRAIHSPQSTRKM